ncbi:MAG TPA: DNA polymerase ligase N-terminal domain-containing protein [bacterium]|nr:DNA polymerase ligase N-terminal domain-containing protein [bacterium]
MPRTPDAPGPAGKSTAKGSTARPAAGKSAAKATAKGTTARKTAASKAGSTDKKAPKPKTATKSVGTTAKESTAAKAKRPAPSSMQPEPTGAKRRVAGQRVTKIKAAAKTATAKASTAKKAIAKAGTRAAKAATTSATPPATKAFRKRSTQAPSAGAEITAGRKAPASLEEYQRMRDFGVTPEPSGTERPPDVGSPMFCVQRHAATALHYDFRLEMGGVLKSWAVPKGPSYDPADKRLAMETEDHPLSYGDFEGLIPEGHYGAGAVMLWDIGTVEYLEEKGTTDPLEQYARGKLMFRLRGTKLNGEWTLVKSRFGGRGNAWLLIKHKDATARAGSDIVTERPDSVKTGRTMEEIAEKGGKQTRERVERYRGK